MLPKSVFLLPTLQIGNGWQARMALTLAFAFVIGGAPAAHRCGPRVVASGVNGTFGSLSNCATIDLGGASLGDAGLRRLTFALARDEPPGLHTIKLSTNELSDPAAIGAFAACSVVKRLVHLDLRHNKLKDSGAVALASSMEAGSALVHIALAGNAIGARGAAALGLAMRRIGQGNNSTMLTLDLWQNKLGDRGVKLFVKSALAPPRVALPLKTLYLSHNAIGDEGASYAALLISQSEMTYLDLQQNTIGDAGAAVIADALGALGADKLPTLTHLFVGFNRITAVGRAALGAALRSNSVIEEIDGGWRRDVAETRSRSSPPEGAPSQWRTSVGYVSPTMVSEAERHAAAQKMHANELRQRDARRGANAAAPAALTLDASAMREGALPPLSRAALQPPRLRLSTQLWGRRVLEWRSEAQSSPLALHFPQLSAAAGIAEITIFAVASVVRRQGGNLSYVRPSTVEQLRRLALLECGATTQRGGLFVAPLVHGVASQLGLLEGAATPNRFDFHDAQQASTDSGTVANSAVRLRAQTCIHITVPFLAKPSHNLDSPLLTCYYLTHPRHDAQRASTASGEPLAPRFAIIVVQKRGRREDMYLNGTLVFSEVLARGARIYGASERCRVGPDPVEQLSIDTQLAELRIFTTAFTTRARQRIEQELYQKWFAAPLWSARDGRRETGHVAENSSALRARILLTECSRVDPLLASLRFDTRVGVNINCTERLGAWEAALAELNERVALEITQWLSWEVWSSCAALCAALAAARALSSVHGRSDTTRVYAAKHTWPCCCHVRRCFQNIAVAQLPALPNTFRALSSVTGHPSVALRLLSREERAQLLVRPSARERWRACAQHLSFASLFIVSVGHLLRVAHSLHVAAAFAAALRLRVATLAGLVLPSNDCSAIQAEAVERSFARHLGASLQLIPLVSARAAISADAPAFILTTLVGGSFLTSWAAAWCEFIR